MVYFIITNIPILLRFPKEMDVILDVNTLKITNEL